MNHCGDARDHLSLYLDGLLDSSAESAMRAHLAGCVACRGLADDLARVKLAADALDPIAPPDHLWPAIASRLALPAADSSTRMTTVAWSWRWGAIAAALAGVAIAGYLLVGSSRSADLTLGTTANGAIEAISNELDLAARHYERAIAELEALTAGSQQELDPALAAVVRDNIGVLDSAIAESRRALTVDPLSDVARISLFEALRRKVDLLQDAVLLININDTRDAQPADDEVPTGASRREL